MSMADRVAVMNNGEVMQIGKPTDLYSHPSTSFIANFVGTSNSLHVKSAIQDGEYTILKGDGFTLKTLHQSKDNGTAIIRPESIQIHHRDTEMNSDSMNILEGEILISTYLGSIVRYEVKFANHQLIVDATYASGESILKPGTKVKLAIDPERVLVI